MAGATERGAVIGRREDGIGEATVGRGVGDELDEPAFEDVVGMFGGEVVGERRDAFEVCRDEGGDEVVARGEVTVERADPDACAPGDVVERRGHAVASERIVGSGEQAVAVPAGVGPEVGISGWRHAQGCKRR